MGDGGIKNFPGPVLFSFRFAYPITKNHTGGRENNGCAEKEEKWEIMELLAGVPMVLPVLCPAFCAGNFMRGGAVLLCDGDGAGIGCRGTSAGVPGLGL